MALVIAAVWALAASRWIATDTVVPWDAKNQFYAFFRFLASAFHAGHTPFWNPYHYGGHPSVADPQSLIFAPAFVAWAWFDAAPSMRTFDLLVYAHLLAGGLAVGAMGGAPAGRCRRGARSRRLHARRTGLRTPAAHRHHPDLRLLPPAMLLLSLALDRRSIVLGAAFGVVTAVLALGRNHEGAAPVLPACRRAGGRDRGRAKAQGVASGSGAGCWRRWYSRPQALLAVPLLLTAQFAALSNRPAVPLESALEASLYPANLATLAVANIMGSLESTAAYWGPNYDTLPEVGATDRSFNYLFIGAAATVVLLWFGWPAAACCGAGGACLPAP